MAFSRRVPLFIALVTGPAILGCGAADGTVRPASFTAEWVGSDTGGLTAAPRATFCPSRGLIQITAIKGDAGVALAIYLADSLTGEFPAFDPGIDTAVPPAVAAAGRWFNDKAVAAYQSDSGSLSLMGKTRDVSGRFGFRLRSLQGVDTVRMTGSFGRVVPGACPEDSVPARPAGE